MSDTYKDHGHPPGWENEHDPRCQACAQSELASSGCSVIRVRYRVDVQSVSGRWDNVEIRSEEAIARRDVAEWRSWLNENRKTWKDIRIVKETTTAEVLQNTEGQTTAKPLSAPDCSPSVELP